MLFQVNKAEYFPDQSSTKIAQIYKETLHQCQKCIFNVFQVLSFFF